MTKLLIALSLFVVACGPNNRNNGGDDDPTVDATPPECTNEGMYRCRGATWEQCANGMWMTEDQCPLACSEGLGCTECVPGQSLCKDGNVWTCDATGKPGAETMVCGGETTCVNGACVDACEEAATSKSYISCEYWAVDLDNATEVLGAIGMELDDGSTLTQQKCSTSNGTVQALDICYQMSGQTLVGTAGLCDPPNTMGGAPTCPSGYTCGSQQACVLNAQASPFAIVLSNPQSKIANVTITGPGGQTIMRAVDPGAVTTVFPQMGGAIPDQSTDGTSKALKAYKVASSLPIVAYQFNPLDNVNVFSNDASLLIPRTTWDTDYYVMSYPTLDRRTVGLFQTPQHHFYGYLTIVAWEDGTQVTVTPKTAVQASATMQSIAANTPTTFTLNAHEVLQLQAKAAAAPGGDLTGTHITSPNMKSFGVFGGTEASSFGEMTAPDNSHTSGPCCADHLEEMMFPSSTWGKTFAIARSKQRTNEPDVLRIMAQKANTTITFTPAPVSGTCGTLGPGQFCSVKISGDTEITASEPILVGHYLQSSMWRDNPFFPFIPVTWVGTGDPSMAIAVPTEQYRKSYTILVPGQYAENYISISATNTGGVTVDNTAINLTAFPGGGAYRAARHPVSAGQHTISCADGCGITVYGYSDAVSYMFAGGLDLKPIVIF